MLRNASKDQTMDQSGFWHVDHGAYRAAYFEAIARAKNELPDELYQSLSTPEAISLPGACLESPIRVLVMGQETFGNYQRLADCGPGDSGGYEAWARQIGGRIAFDYATGGNASQQASTFWRAFDEISVALKLGSRKALAWSNLFKVQIESQTDSVSMSRRTAADQMEVVRWQLDLFRAEMEYIKPDAIVFLTGSTHWVMDHMFKGRHRLRTKDEFKIVEIDDLEIPMIQTFHPGAARFKGAAVNEVRSKAVEFLKSELGR